MSGSSSSSSSSHAFVTTVCTIAAAAAVSLSVLQTDTVSRRVLSSQKLQRKRVHEYQYRWDWTLKKFLLRYARKGHDQQMDKANTEVFFQDEDIQGFIETKLLNEGNISIMSIEVDDDTLEYYIFFVNNTNQHMYQLPLAKFSVHLNNVMQDRLTSTTLCFIADASSGLSGSLLSTVLRESKAGVTVIQEPLWMALVANLVEKQLYSEKQMKQLLFGLCRFEAWRVGQTAAGATKTVAFVLPGQACTPALVPLLQSIFPCERHVFAYDSCTSSVKRALLWQKNNNHSTAETNNGTIEFHDCITATTPLSSTSLTASIKTLADSLSKLPIQLADTTETWMTSVHAFLQMKENERVNEYLPFVLKLSLLSDDSTKRLALQNILQFITGSRSRPLSPQVMDAAVESLRDFQENQAPLLELSPEETRQIEDCVFQHKSILIENKTLVDTVVPQKEWTLKAAKKISGCACCAPDEEDEEEESSVAKRERNRPKYVDGKTAFAFDPTQFG